LVGTLGMLLFDWLTLLNAAILFDDASITINSSKISFDICEDLLRQAYSTGGLQAKPGVLRGKKFPLPRFCPLTKCS